MEEAAKENPGEDVKEDTGENYGENEAEDIYKKSFGEDVGNTTRRKLW